MKYSAVLAATALLLVACDQRSPTEPIRPASAEVAAQASGQPTFDARAYPTGVANGRDATVFFTVVGTPQTVCEVSATLESDDRNERGSGSAFVQLDEMGRADFGIVITSVIFDWTTNKDHLLNAVVNCGVIVFVVQKVNLNRDH